ncbi:MAG: ABC transporter permease subunit [Anaerolineae bacterium]
MGDLLARLRRDRTRITIFAVLLALFLMAIGGMSTKDWLITTLRGFSVGAVVFLVAAGFSIILGLMDVLNLAQGTLYMIGAYVGWSVYVRSDTFVDLLTPLALIAAGLLLQPLWTRVLERLTLSRRVTRIWPWIALLLGIVLLVFTVARAPLAIWDPENYSDSPISWTQAFDTGQVSALVEPATWEGLAPVIGLVALIASGALMSAGLAGFARGQTAGPTGDARGRALPWRTIAIVVALVVVGLGAHLANDALTAFLFNMNHNWLFLLALVVATLVGGGLGALMEATLIRPLYERALYQIMLTFGLSFVGIEIVRAIWGRQGFTMAKPPLFAGSGEGCPATSLAGWLQYHCATLEVTIGGEVARIRVYNELFVPLLGLLVLVAVWLLLQRTRLGMIIRAGVQDSDMVEALGINVRQVFTLVFGLGVSIAALGGIVSAPATGLSDLMGGDLLLGALVALAVGGLTSYPGAAVGAALVGLVQQFMIKYGQIGINLPFLDEPFKPTPPLIPASTVLLMIIILVIMPQGLLGRKE